MTAQVAAPSTTDAAALVRELVGRAISRIRFTYAAIPTTLTFDEDRFAVDLVALDRETGESTTVRLLYWLPPVLASQDAAVEWIYRCVREGWVHELNEAIFVDGTRRRDLHKPSTHMPGGIHHGSAAGRSGRGGALAHQDRARGVPARHPGGVRACRADDGYGASSV